MFGTLRGAPLAPLFAFAPGAARLSARMQAAWAAFARDGDPGHDDLPEWPAYDAASDRYLDLGPVIEVFSPVSGDGCDIMERLYPVLWGGAK